MAGSSSLPLTIRFAIHPLNEKNLDFSLILVNYVLELVHGCTVML